MSFEKVQLIGYAPVIKIVFRRLRRNNNHDVGNNFRVPGKFPLGPQLRSGLICLWMTWFSSSGVKGLSRTGNVIQNRRVTQKKEKEDRNENILYGLRSRGRNVAFAEKNLLNFCALKSNASEDQDPRRVCLRPEWDGSCQQCDWDQGIEGWMMIETYRRSCINLVFGLNLGPLYLFSIENDLSGFQTNTNTEQENIHTTHSPTEKTTCASIYLLLGLIFARINFREDLFSRG